MSIQTTLATASGLIGDVCILGSYYYLHLGKMKVTDLSYLYINLVGTIGITASLLHDWNLPAFVIEVCWALITLYGLNKAYRQGRESIIRNADCQ